MTNILANNIPIVSPICVFESVKTIRQIPNAAINIPMPNSARAVQWHRGKAPLWAVQTLNRNCGPSAISKPNAITIDPVIMLFFIFAP